MNSNECARKGIILAGGAGTRLHPATQVISKQLLPVYDKPMVYYPLSLLMLAQIRDMLLISTPRDLPLFRSLFGDGQALGLSIEYAEQAEPRGLAEAFLIAEAFLADHPACLVLGDNILYGHSVGPVLRKVSQESTGATIFAYGVKNPSRYGVVEFDAAGRALSIEEKPERPRSRFAVPGIYFYDAHVCQFARQVQPSARGELEITSVHQMYLEKEALNVEVLGRGIAWFDAGTHESLLHASVFIEAIQERQGTMIACLEEIAFRNGWIDARALEAAVARLGNSAYASYLRRIPEES